MKRDIREVAGDLEEGIVLIDGDVLPLEPSLKVRNHSPSGFSWGYGGSGPAQLSLAILLEVYDREIAERYYQNFKWDVIARLPRADFRVAMDFTTIPPRIVENKKGVKA